MKKKTMFVSEMEAKLQDKDSLLGGQYELQ